MGYEFKDYPFTAKHYEAELPALADGVETKRHAVTIVGGGPVGLALALGLANHGVAVGRDRGRRHGVLRQPRHLHLAAQPGDHRAAGRAAGVPGEGPALDRRAQLLPGHRGASLRDAARREPEAAADGQPRAVLHRAVPAGRAPKQRARPDRHPLADPASTGIDAREDGATLRLSHPAGRLHAARRLAGRPATAAGASCAKTLGLQLEGTSYEGRYVIVDIELQERPPDRAAGLVRPAVQPGLDRADAQAAGRHLAHRLPAARRRGHRTRPSSRKT